MVILAVKIRQVRQVEPHPVEPMIGAQVNRLGDESTHGVETNHANIENDWFVEVVCGNRGHTEL